MKRTLLLSTLLFAGSVLAQTAPSMGVSDLKPTDGESFTYQISSYLEPTGSGANQTWDFSSVTPSTNTTSYTAHHVANSSTDVYFEENGAKTYQTYASDGIYQTGITLPNYAGITYTNSMKILPFPLEENSFSDDQYETTQTVNGQAIVESGSFKTEYHGYGTLITPAGTFNDVICMIQIRTYTTTIGGQPSGTGIISGYQFYKPGIHQHIMGMTTSVYNGNASQTGSYLDVSTADISEMNKIAFIVAPNPATDGFNISGDNAVKTVQLFDLNGKEIQVSYDATTNFVNISHLTPGVYHLQVITDAGMATQKVVKR